MIDEQVFEIQRLYPQIYFACHVDHVRASSTKWRLSSHDSAILAHLSMDKGTSQRELQQHLMVVPSTLSASIKKLVRLGYIRSDAVPGDRRKRELRLSKLGAEAIASTSVLDGKKLRMLLDKLSPEDREAAVSGMAKMARAAKELSEEEKR